MIWKKTALGLTEIKARSLSIDPATRNLLLLVDGVKSEAMLLRHGIGVSAEQFRSLFALRLIEPVDGEEQRPGPDRSPSSPSPSTGPAKPGLSAASLNRLISSELGLAGFRLTDEVQQARTAPELQAIAERVIVLIRRRKGNRAAEEATSRLWGRG